MMTADRSLDKKKAVNMVSDYLIPIWGMGNPFLVSKMKKKRYFIAFLQSEKWQFVPIYGVLIGTEQLRDSGNNTALSVKNHPSVSVGIRRYPSVSVGIRRYPSVSVGIRRYPSVSVGIRRYPSVSVGIRRYPSVSVGIRRYPSVSVGIRRYPSHVANDNTEKGIRADCEVLVEIMSEQ